MIIFTTADTENLIRREILIVTVFFKSAVCIARKSCFVFSSSFTVLNGIIIVYNTMTLCILSLTWTGLLLTFNLHYPPLGMTGYAQLLGEPNSRLTRGWVDICFSHLLSSLHKNLYTAFERYEGGCRTYVSSHFSSSDIISGVMSSQSLAS